MHSKPPLIIKFTHINLPERIKSFNGNMLRLDRNLKIYLDDREIAEYHKGWDGEYFRVWNDETFYQIYSNMEIKVDAIPGE